MGFLFYLLYNSSIPQTHDMRSKCVSVDNTMKYYCKDNDLERKVR